MRRPLSAIDDAGLALRALRRHAAIRIDDFALTARVSKRFLTDVENGKPTVQMGKVLALLKSLAVKLVTELPDISEPAVNAERQLRSRRKAARGSGASSDA